MLSCVSFSPVNAIIVFGVSVLSLPFHRYVCYKYILKLKFTIRVETTVLSFGGFFFFLNEEVFLFGIRSNHLMYLL